MKSAIQLFLTAALMLLFSYAAISKLADPGLFRAQLYLQPFPHAVADVLVVAIPALELAAIGLLCRERTYPAGLWLSLILMSAFTLYIALILLLSPGPLPCSCGGILNRLSWRAHLIFNICFVLASAAAIRLNSRKHPADLPAVS